MEKIFEKRIMRIALLLLVVCISPLSMYSVDNLEKSSSDSKEVETKGTWEKPKTRSLTSIPVAYIDDNILVIQNVSQSCDITIQIVSNGQIVYEQEVPASATYYIPIPLYDFSAGEYTLILQSPNGGYLTGDFSI